MVSRKSRGRLNGWPLEGWPPKFASEPVEAVHHAVAADNSLLKFQFPGNVCQQDAKHNGENPLAGEDKHDNAEHNQGTG
jgi:hypothetical protein